PLTAQHVIDTANVVRVLCHRARFDCSHHGCGVIAGDWPEADAAAAVFDFDQWFEPIQAQRAGTHDGRRGCGMPDGRGGFRGTDRHGRTVHRNEEFHCMAPVALSAWAHNALTRSTSMRPRVRPSNWTAGAQAQLPRQYTASTATSLLPCLAAAVAADQSARPPTDWHASARQTLSVCR